MADITKALAKAGAEDLVDQKPWVPRARHSICLSEMKLREAETDREREQRMLALIAKINDLGISTQRFASGGTRRPKADRGNGSHASKVRRLLHMVSADFDEVDAVYDTGSVWRKDLLIASVDLPRNGAHVRKGKLDSSWIDLVALSKTTHGPVAGGLGEYVATDHGLRVAAAHRGGIALRWRTLIARNLLKRGMLVSLPRVRAALY